MKIANRLMLSGNAFKKMTTGLTTGVLTANLPISASPKAYVVVDSRVKDPTGYLAYLSAISPVVMVFGGTDIARAGRSLLV